MADAFELLAERHDRNKVRRLEYTGLERLAAHRILKRRRRGKSKGAQQQDGPDIYVMGSADLLQTLFKNDLVDEMELMIFPITLGTGKRLFTHGTIPAAFKVTESQVSPNGIIIINYERAGDVKTVAPQIEENDQ